MRKFLISLLCITLSLSTPLLTYAQEQNTAIGHGYTSDGIYYTVYEIETMIVPERAVGDKLVVSREFQFSGVIQPPSEKKYTEYVNGVCYTGTLKLTAFTYENGNTLAVYTGTLIAVN